MNYEKICREYAFEKGFEKDLCKLFVQKEKFELNCTSDENESTMNWVSISEELPEIRKITTGIESNVTKFLCKGEDYAQIRISQIDSKRNSIAAIGPLIVLWFAGPWSDRKKLRLPCMLVPYLGEAIGFGSE